MPADTHFMSDRPSTVDAGIDVVSEILDAAHLTTAVFGRLELGMPWRLRIPARSYLSFYVVARGGGWIEVEGADAEANGAAGGTHLSQALSAGDAVLLPRGTAHVLRDANGGHALAQEIEYSACPAPWIGEGAHFGGAGPTTAIVTGQFTFSGGGARNPLLDTLPSLIHLPAGAVGSHPQLAGVVPLILSESARPGPHSR